MNISIGSVVLASFKYEFEGKVTELKTPGNVLNPENNKEIDGIFLWDTGATASCINSQIPFKIGLDFKGVTQIHTANGIVNANTYIASIILKGVQEEKTTTLQKKQLVTAVDLGPNILGLIGMDIIGLGSFLVNYNDSTDKHILQFSFPTLQKLNDFNFKDEAYKQNQRIFKEFEKKI